MRSQNGNTQDRIVLRKKAKRNKMEVINKIINNER